MLCNLFNAHVFYSIIIVSLFMNFAVIIYFYLKFRRKINTNIDHYLLILNILDQRVTEYKKMYAIYKQKLNKQYQIDNPTITFNKESYTKCLQQYVNNLVRNLLQEFSRESRNELLHIFSEEGLIRYITDRILE